MKDVPQNFSKSERPSIVVINTTLRQKKKIPKKRRNIADESWIANKKQRKNEKKIHKPGDVVYFQNIKKTFIQNDKQKKDHGWIHDFIKLKKNETISLNEVNISDCLLVPIENLNYVQIKKIKKNKMNQK